MLMHGWVRCSVSDPDPEPEPDSGGLPDPDPGAYKKAKMLNNHDIILLFSDFYNILSFN